MKEIYRSPWFNLEGYLACTVKYADGSKKTILQHREVVENYLGRKLNSNEIVHHRDENKRNNKEDNLEVLSQGAHARRHQLGKGDLSLICVACDKEFTRRGCDERYNRKQGKHGPFCGKSCVGKYYRKLQLENGSGPKKADIVCGTRSAYRKGCRCVKCKACNAQKMRDYRSRKRIN